MNGAEWKQSCANLFILKIESYNDSLIAQNVVNYIYIYIYIYSIYKLTQNMSMS